MKLSVLLLLVVDITCTVSETNHEVSVMLGCFEGGLTEAEASFDSEEIAYVDYAMKDIVYTVPTYIMSDKVLFFDHDELYQNADEGASHCSSLLNAYDAEENYPEEVQDPPVSIIYPADEVLLNAKNSLVCFVNGFYPPAINVSWTKNGHPVSKGVSISRFYPNQDHTFRQISTLTFTPKEGDIYTCIVEHHAMEEADTKIWEVTLYHRSVIPGVICGLGLACGVVLMAAGMILAFKEKAIYQK